MTSFNLLAGVGLLALSASATAQYAPIAPVAPTGDADRLAADMRLVAADPRNVPALVEAGELSLKLGDLSGAASLFARADRIDPRNGRVKAGMADVLLRGERPGEALLYFGQAEGYGLPVATFAADRGLAYDLIGQQGRAQRDYRTALAVRADDETARRYALSLAISGQKDAALLQLDPLVRHGDRGAWRTRAFILAMSGDSAGATDIARRMMAPGQAEGLAPFFQRLPTLNPVDRAFAVQFGEVRPTPQRIADARMAPALPPMAPEIVAVPVVRSAPVQVAAAAKPAPRKRGRRDVEVAAATPVAVAPVQPALPTPPAYTEPVQLAYAAPARTALPYRLARPGTGTDPVSAANAAMLAASRATVAAPARGAVLAAMPVRTASTTMTVPTGAIRPFVASTPVPQRLVAPVAGAVSAPTPAVTPAPPPMAPAVASPVRRQIPATANVSAFTEQFRAARVRDAAASSANRAALAATPGAVATGPAGTGAASTLPAAVPVARTATVSPTPVPVEAAVASSANAGQQALAPILPGQPNGDGDAVLARLLSGITLPGEELARAAQVAAAPADAPANVVPSATSRVTPAQPAPAQPAPFPSTVTDTRPASEESVGRTTRTVAPSERRDRVESNVSAGVPSTTHAVSGATGQATVEASTRRSRRGRSEPADEVAGRTARDQASDEAGSAGRSTRKTSTGSARRGRGDPAEQSTGKSRRDQGDAGDDAGTARTERAGRQDGDQATGKRGRRGRQVAEADDAPPSPAEKRAADRKAAADKKAAEARKLADAQKLADAKAVADEKKAAKAEPERYWVQVSGGANQSDLPKAWVKAQGQAPALKGRAGYTAPLRATNRVLAGPFKTNAEAKAFMDKVRAQGIPAWQFTSQSGQKVSKLP